MRSLRGVATAWVLRHFVKPRVGKGTLEEGRRAFEKMASRVKPPRGTVVETVSMGGLQSERLTLPGADSGRALLWFFGGGYQAGSPLCTRALAARIAGQINAPAVVPAYRLCPEHSLDAALDDALVAYRWLVRDLGSADQIVVGGESAGGGLAIRLLCALRDAGDPLPAAAVLMSAWTDLAMTAPSLKVNAASEAIFGPAFFEGLFANLIVADTRDPSISPLYADLSGLPPLLIQVSGDEALLDDSVRLAERARTAGVDVTLRVFPGLWHVFQAQPSIPEAGAAINEIAAFAGDRLSRRAISKEASAASA